MLQPVAVIVVQVATLKLLLAVVWYGHGDEWVHVVKALLIRDTKVVGRFYFSAVKPISDCFRLSQINLRFAVDSFHSTAI